MATIRVQREDFDASAEAEALARGRTDVGAVVSFVGYCRDEGGSLAALELEHYPGMVEEEVARAMERPRPVHRFCGRPSSITIAAPRPAIATFFAPAAPRI